MSLKAVLLPVAMQILHVPLFYFFMEAGAPIIGLLAPPVSTMQVTSEYTLKVKADGILAQRTLIIAHGMNSTVRKIRMKETSLPPLFQRFAL